MSAGASAEEARSALQDLMREKDRLEANIEALTEFLSSGNMPGLKGGLIDADGFPRADIDLYQVRDARHKIACYQNDHKAVMRKIEEGLCNLHAVSKVSVPIAGGKSRKEGGEGDAASASAAKRLKLGVGPPFAVIDSVSPGSPAEAAGVQANDFLKKFGTITLGAPNGPQTVADCFREIRSQVVEGRPIEVVVERRLLVGGGAITGMDPPSAGAGAASRPNALHPETSNLAATAPLGAAGGSGSQDQLSTSCTPMEVCSATPPSDATGANRGDEIRLELIPRRWDGMGLLGCHIVPFDA